jgi:glycine/sarcosine N-methyltransferase
MYDDFSQDYDRFVDWPARLEMELPFIEKQIDSVSAQTEGRPSILDSACGTGMHAIALAQRGYRLAGADLSPAMVDHARHNAAAAEVEVRFATAGFGNMAVVFGEEFDGVLCLGNSLPHILDENELKAALRDFARCTRPGSFLLIQNRNFDDVLARRLRWMEPQNHNEGNFEWVFVRFYDFDPDERLTFHIITLRREGDQPWSQRFVSTRLMPIRQAHLIQALAEAGFRDIVSYGDMSGAPFAADGSPNLIVRAIKG